MKCAQQFDNPMQVMPGGKLQHYIVVQKCGQSYAMLYIIIYISGAINPLLVTRETNPGRPRKKKERKQRQEKPIIFMSVWGGKTNSYTGNTKAVYCIAHDCVACKWP